MLMYRSSLDCRSRINEKERGIERLEHEYKWEARSRELVVLMWPHSAIDNPNPQDAHRESSGLP